jgi:hypothetical protein
VKGGAIWNRYSELEFDVRAPGWHLRTDGAINDWPRSLASLVNPSFTTIAAVRNKAALQTTAHDSDRQLQPGTRLPVTSNFSTKVGNPTESLSHCEDGVQCKDGEQVESEELEPGLRLLTPLAALGCARTASVVHVTSPLKLRAASGAQVMRRRLYAEDKHFRLEAEQCELASQARDIFYRNLGLALDILVDKYGMSEADLNRPISRVDYSRAAEPRAEGEL